MSKSVNAQGSILVNSADAASCHQQDALKTYGLMVRLAAYSLAISKSTSIAANADQDP